MVHGVATERQYNWRMDQQATIDQIMAWAREDERIRAVVVTGSWARGAADSLSDLDIELYVTDPFPLLESDSWYRQFGEVLVIEALENEGWNPTRLIYYAGGKIDFTILSISLLHEAVAYDRPFRVLIDKDGANAFRAVPLPPALQPAPAEFLECINWFYAAMIMWAKYVARGDLWAAKLRDWESKGQLLRMLEWDQQARKGREYDTWYLGLHLRAWVDPDLMPFIEACWSGIDAVESSRAIYASLTLFDSLSRRAAAVLDYAPFDSSGVRAEVERILDAVP